MRGDLRAARARPAAEAERSEYELHRNDLSAPGCRRLLARLVVPYYFRDPTRVVFYREAAFRVLARRFGWQCEVPCKAVVLLRKPGG